MKGLKNILATTISIMAIGIMTILILQPTADVHAFDNNNATGDITKLKQSAATATVQGYVEDGSYLWLGLSFKCGEGPWRDKPAKKVDKGNFSVDFSLGNCHGSYRTVRSCLWKRANGHLLDGRVVCKEN